MNDFKDVQEKDANKIIIRFLKEKQKENARTWVALIISLIVNIIIVSIFVSFLCNLEVSVEYKNTELSKNGAYVEQAQGGDKKYIYCFNKGVYKLD